MNPIIVPHETVNDDSVVVLDWTVEDGSYVKQGDILGEIETSKAALDIEAPSAGFFRALVPVGGSAGVGATLAYVMDTEDEQMPDAPAAKTPPPQARTGESQFSRKAEELVTIHGLDRSRFTQRLVTESDVLKVLDSQGSSGPGLDAGASAEPGDGVARQRVDKRKMAEIAVLRQGLEQTMHTVVTAYVPVTVLASRVGEDAVLSGNVTALFVKEAAALLETHPNFNAIYRAGEILTPPAMNVGFAVDGEFGLKVLVVREPNQRSLEDVADAMRDLLVSYVDESLAEHDVTGATFTVSDLSGLGVAQFDPLIPGGTSAILGVGYDDRRQGAFEGSYAFTLAFDHQTASGAHAASFLADLKERVQRHDRELASLLPASSETGLFCAWCFRSIEELHQIQAHLMSEVTADGAEGFICSNCLAGF